MVYVDSANIPYGRMIMCHMIADTTGELLKMADTIGVARQHLQKREQYDEHFDVCRAKRISAVEAGAEEVSVRAIVRIMQAKRQPLS